MEDKVQSAGRGSSSSDCFEPERKKRCVRYPSDLSAEDPLLASDSGFGDLPSEPKLEQENGDLEVSPFFDVDSSGVFNVSEFETQGLPHERVQHSFCSIRTSSVESIAVESEFADTSILDPDSEVSGPKQLEESHSNSSSSSSDPCCSSGSCSRSSSANGNHDADPDSPLDENLIDIILNPKELFPGSRKAMILQRLLSQFRTQPHNGQLQQLIEYLLSSPELSAPRHRLRHVTTIHDAARLLRCSKKILVLTGAGISVSCGIPDFRSKDGLYARVSKVFPELKDPQSVFDVRLFRRDPRPFFLTAKELYPGQFEPSLSHRFIKKLEDRGQLLRNYSQNIDTLETIAGIEKVTMCHGSFSTATCIRCGFKVSSEEIKDKVLSGEVPYCTSCSTPEETNQIMYPLGGEQRALDVHGHPIECDDDEEDFMPMMDSFPLPPVVKPDIVFFGEDLPDEFHTNLNLDKPDVDLVVVIGSSLRVRPVSLIPGMVSSEVPQILINRESLPHCRFDVELLGNCDAIIAHLCKMMGPDFTELAVGPDLNEIEKLPKGPHCVDEEVSEPKSEHDIQALKACWEPKTNEKLVDRLPANTFLSWRTRQYIFEGAEEIFDPDDDEPDDDDSSDNSSCSSLPIDENRDREVDEELGHESEQDVGQSLNSENLKHSKKSEDQKLS